MKLRWKEHILHASVAIVGIALLVVLVETVKAKNTGFETKTLWDWMELLIIPTVLAFGAIALNRSEKSLERHITVEQQQEAALQSYLDRIADLMLERSLVTTLQENIKNVARIRTLTVLRRLDARRKRIVLLFLCEAKLINAHKPVVKLKNAALSRADLSYAKLDETDLSFTDLEEAELLFSELRGSDLEGVNLHRANLEGANLEHTIITDAFLDSANLASANLNNAVLKNTFLAYANLSFAHLDGADLTNALLQGAILTGATLKAAVLKDATVTNEQLNQAASLEGAIMPDGTKHN